MKAKRKSGYSKEIANIYVPDDTNIVLLSTQLEPRFKWENHKPTNQISGIVYYVEFQITFST